MIYDDLTSRAFWDRRPPQLKSLDANSTWDYFNSVQDVVRVANGLNGRMKVK